MYGFDSYSATSFSGLVAPSGGSSTEVAQQGYPQVFDSNSSVTATGNFAFIGDAFAFSGNGFGFVG